MIGDKGEIVSTKAIKTLCGALDREHKLFCDRLKGHEGEHRGSKVMTYQWAKE